MTRILVVDDEFDLVKTLQAILEAEGYETASCSNGREALECIQSNKPDLVLMDVMMPLLSGYEVIAKLNANSETRSIPVILMSAVPPTVKQEDYGWKAFLRKPFPLLTLVRTVTAVLGKRARPA